MAIVLSCLIILCFVILTIIVKYIKDSVDFESYSEKVEREKERRNLEELK